MKLEDFLPMSPNLGPPLPKFLGIHWPWYTEAPEEGAAQFYMPSELEVSESGPYGDNYYRVTFSTRITNRGNAAGRGQITWESNYLGEFEEEGSRIISLDPGKSYDWSVTYDDVFDYYRGYFTCRLAGDWPANNKAEGVWK